MNSKLIYRFLKPRMNYEKEVFWVVGFDTCKNIICAEQIFMGTINRCPIYPREIFRFALMNNAEEIVLAHSHTTKDVYPSKKDKEVTLFLRKLSQELDVKIVDHLIIHKEHYFSFLDHRLIF